MYIQQDTGSLSLIEHMNEGKEREREKSLQY
jgi:hypothetical protein